MNKERGGKWMKAERVRKIFSIFKTYSKTDHYNKPLKRLFDKKYVLDERYYDHFNLRGQEGKSWTCAKRLKFRHSKLIIYSFQPVSVLMFYVFPTLANAFYINNLHYTLLIIFV